MFNGRAARFFATALLWSAAAMAADLPPVTDPTAPPYEAKGESIESSDETLLLYSTHVSPESQSAVVNNQVVTIGSRIEGAIVTGIEQGRVTLRRGAESIVLKLLLPPVKRPAKDAQ